MDDLKKAELRQLAEACDRTYANLCEVGGDDAAAAWNAAEDAYSVASDSPAVLELLDEIETLQGLYRMHQQTETREMRDLKAERDQLRAEVEALSFLLKRFVDGEHDNAENQSERHHYHGEAHALLERLGGEFREYGMVPYEALLAQRKDAERYRWLRERCGVDFIFGDYNPWIPAEGVEMEQAERDTTDASIDLAMAKEGGANG